MFHFLTTYYEWLNGQPPLDGADYVSTIGLTILVLALVSTFLVTASLDVYGHLHRHPARV